MNRNLYKLLTAVFISLFSGAMAQSPARMPDKRIKILLIGTCHCSP